MAVFPTAAKQALEALKQGPVAVVFDPDKAVLSAALELLANEGTELNFQHGQEVAEADAIGVYDIYTTGDSLEFSLNLDETSLDVVEVLFRQGLDGTTYWGWGGPAGDSERADALKVRIRPWATRDAATLQLEIWKVVPFGDATKSMTKAAPWRFTQTFKALPDLTQDERMLLAKLTLPVRA